MFLGNSNTNRHDYWAAAPVSEIADRILDKVDKYFQYLQMSGRLDLYRRSWQYYYRPRITGGSINQVGQQGELSALSVNHYRNLLTHLETMTLQQRLSFEPVAINNDVESQAQAILAQGLLDYYMRIKKLERFIKQGVKDGLMYAEGFVRAEWDVNGGDTYGKSPTGAILYQGDIKYSNYTPLTCIRDFTKPNYSKDDPVILKDFVNKFELAAKFPELREKILDDSLDAMETSRTTVLNFLALDDSDLIAQYTLLHPPTPALPTGRFTTCLDNGTVLQDGPIPYEETHVYRIAPDEESGTIFGYTVAFDLLPIQEAIDIVYSTALTNVSTFGVQNILMPKGHDISVSQLSGGLNVVEYDPKVGKPEALQLTQTAPEVYNFMTTLENIQQTLAGVDSVTRGDPSASLKSGAALALVAAQSIQFSMGLQQSYVNLAEDLGSGTIALLQVFAAVPRVAEIAGKSNRPLMREFTGEQLSAVKRVAVNMGNPMTQTLAGKTNLVEWYMNNNMIENPDQVVQVMTTGRLEQAIQSKQSNNLLAKDENENLSEGKAQRVLITDNHAKHVLEHQMVLDNPEIRQDPENQIVAVTLAHIQEHMTMAQSPGYQMIAAMLGHQIVAPPAAPAAPGSPGEMMDPNVPPVQAAEEVQQPNMPEPPAGTAPQDAEVIQGMAGAMPA